MTFSKSESLVTSTAWASMSTPKMCVVRMRFFSAMVRRHSPFGFLYISLLEFFGLVLHVPLEAMVEQALKRAQQE